MSNHWTIIKMCKNKSIINYSYFSLNLYIKHSIFIIIVKMLIKFTFLIKWYTKQFDFCLSHNSNIRNYFIMCKLFMRITGNIFRVACMKYSANYTTVFSASVFKTFSTRFTVFLRALSSAQLSKSQIYIK